MVGVSFESCCDVVVALSFHSVGTIAACINRTSTVAALHEHYFNLLPMRKYNDNEIHVH